VSALMLCRQPQCMASLEAFNPSVPGIDAFEDDADATTQKDLIHIRVQQRNGRKCITTVQGLSEQLDLKKIIKAVKKARAPPLFCASLPAIAPARSPLRDRPCASLPLDSFLRRARPHSLSLSLSLCEFHLSASHLLAALPRLRPRKRALSRSPCISTARGLFARRERASNRDAQLLHTSARLAFDPPSDSYSPTNPPHSSAPSPSADARPGLPSPPTSRRRLPDAAAPRPIA